MTETFSVERDTMAQNPQPTVPASFLRSASPHRSCTPLLADEDHLPLVSLVRTTWGRIRGTKSHRNRRSSTCPPWDKGQSIGLSLGIGVSEPVVETILQIEGQLAEMAPTPVHHRLPPSALRSIPSSFPSSAPSCIPPRSNWCSVTRFVAGELGKPREVRRVGILRAAPGSEVVAPAPVEKEDGPNLPCDTCNGKGWLVCDFCKGQKTNVQVRANKFYRRCPSCRAVGVVICPQCKVFKCVTFPDGVDGY